MKEHDPDGRVTAASAYLQSIRSGTLQLKDMCFSDEKWSDNNDIDPTEWCPPNGRPSARCCDRFPPKVHVWGMIGIGVKVLHIVPRGTSIDHLYYRDHILKPHLPFFQGKVLMQDNARPHVKCEAWLKKNKVKMLKSWPPRSPDLNPIEVMWAMIQAKVDERGPMEESELVQFWQDEWEAIPQESVDKLVLKWERVLEACVKNSGELVRWGQDPAKRIVMSKRNVAR